MVTTRGSGSAGSQNRENVQENPVPPPPPPPAEGPDWNQMMANQAQLINLIAQSINNAQTLQAAATAVAAQPKQLLHLLQGPT